MSKFLNDFDHFSGPVFRRNRRFSMRNNAQKTFFKPSSRGPTVRKLFFGRQSQNGRVKNSFSAEKPGTDDPKTFFHPSFPELKAEKLFLSRWSAGGRLKTVFQRKISGRTTEKEFFSRPFRVGSFLPNSLIPLEISEQVNDLLRCEGVE